MFSLRKKKRTDVITIWWWDESQFDSTLPLAALAFDQCSVWLTLLLAALAFDQCYNGKICEMTLNTTTWKNLLKSCCDHNHLMERCPNAYIAAAWYTLAIYHMLGVEMLKSCCDHNHLMERCPNAYVVAAWYIYFGNFIISLELKGLFTI
jgi:hypothetical protein